jgi:hypothetical protein
MPRACWPEDLQRRAAHATTILTPAAMPLFSGSANISNDYFDEKVDSYQSAWMAPDVRRDQVLILSFVSPTAIGRFYSE